MALYHFTDSRNIESIMTHGLLSWPLLYRLDIDAVMGSSELSRNLDARRDHEDYVRLATQPDHPMLYYAKNDGRIDDYVWLEIDEAILNKTGVLYSSTNATANGAIIDSNSETAFEYGDNQAEVLVPSRIDPQYISLFENGENYDWDCDDDEEDEDWDCDDDEDDENYDWDCDDDEEDEDWNCDDY